jgi:hypothetical protein
MHMFWAIRRRFWRFALLAKPSDDNLVAWHVGVLGRRFDARVVGVLRLAVPLTDAGKRRRAVRLEQRGKHRSVGMSGSERLDPKCGPFANLWLTYSSGLDALAKGYEPVVLGLGRCQAELMTLALRRTQAWLDRPMRLSRCRTPQDAVGEHLSFWQTAGAQYAESSQRVLAAVLSTTGAPLAAAGSTGADREARDYIAVAGRNEKAAALPPIKDRRAA